MCLCSSSIHRSTLFVNALAKYIAAVSVVPPNTDQVIVVDESELVFSVFALLHDERISITQELVLRRVSCIRAVSKRLVEPRVLFRLDKLRRCHELYQNIVALPNVRFERHRQIQVVEVGISLRDGVSKKPAAYVVVTSARTSYRLVQLEEGCYLVCNIALLRGGRVNDKFVENDIAHVDNCV